MRLEEKHKLAIDDDKFCQREAEKIIEKIKRDDSGACWHKDEVFSEMQNQAKYLDALPKDEKLKKPLLGLSVGMKDLFAIKGMTTTAGSKVLESFKTPYDSHLWSSLHNKGAFLGAKLAMDEFAMGSFSNTSPFGKVSIPGFPNHTAGGSSGGSGAAVAADLVDFSLGSDTGGSVRLPASFCSTVGYKPSYGAFSRYGMIAYASSLDQAGFLTKSLDDLHYILSSDIAKKDDKDMTSIGLGNPLWKGFNKSWTVGFFEDFLTSEDIQSEVRVAYAKSLEAVQQAGATLLPVDVLYMRHAAQIYYIIACSEASSNLARYQGVFFGKKLIDKERVGDYWEQVAQYRSEYFGLEVQKRIMLGSYILSAENFTAMYQKAVSLRKLLKLEFNKVFEKVDTLVLPVSPMVSPTWDKISSMTSAQIYMSDFMTVPFSLAGLPALSLPWYKTKNGLGIGIQVVGKHFSDYQLVEHFKNITTILDKDTSEIIGE